MGLANSWIKDFYDVWVIPREIDLEGALLAEAIKATFTQRQTPVGHEPLALFQKDFMNGIATAVGVVTGDLIFIVMVMIGLVALSEVMGAFFAIIRCLAAGYLIWLGWCLMRCGVGPSSLNRFFVNQCEATDAISSPPQ